MTGGTSSCRLLQRPDVVGDRAVRGFHGTRQPHRQALRGGSDYATGLPLRRRLRYRLTAAALAANAIRLRRESHRRGASASPICSMNHVTSTVVSSILRRRQRPAAVGRRHRRRARHLRRHRAIPGGHRPQAVLLAPLLRQPDITQPACPERHARDHPLWRHQRLDGVSAVSGDGAGGCCPAHSADCAGKARYPGRVLTRNNR